MSVASPRRPAADASQETPSASTRDTPPATGNPAANQQRWEETSIVIYAGNLASWIDDDPYLRA